MIFLASGLIMFASCKTKEYTCRCEGGFSGAGETTTITATRSRAEKQCYSKESAPGTADGFYDCVLR